MTSRFQDRAVVLNCILVCLEAGDCGKHKPLGYTIQSSSTILLCVRVLFRTVPLSNSEGRGHPQVPSNLFSRIQTLQLNLILCNESNLILLMPVQLIPEIIHLKPGCLQVSLGEIS